MNKWKYRCYVIFIVAAFIICCTGCEKRNIINGVEEKEANEILVILASKDIDAIKQNAPISDVGGSKVSLYNIQVSPDNVIDAMAILNKYGFPRRKTVTLLDIFSSQGLVPSELQEKIRYRSGKEEEIASIIRKIDGVVDANVQLSFPEESALLPGNEGQSKATASVYVKHQGILDDPNSHLVTKIKRLVASSVANLSYDDVTIVPDKARFSDIQLLDSSTDDAEKEYVKVWSVIIAKESLYRFRMIFFTFSFLIIVSFAIIGWLMWKLFPILHNQGFKQLFLPVPFSIEQSIQPEFDEDEDYEEEEEE